MSIGATLVGDNLTGTATYDGVTGIVRNLFAVDGDQLTAAVSGSDATGSSAGGFTAARN